MCRHKSECMGDMKRHRPNDGLMMGQRSRRSANNKSTLDEGIAVGENGYGEPLMT